MQILSFIVCFRTTRWHRKGERQKKKREIMVVPSALLWPEASQRAGAQGEQKEIPAVVCTKYPFLSHTCDLW
jgi:hypothetical protein